MTPPTDADDRELTPREQVEATVWRILRARYVALLAPGVAGDEAAENRVLEDRFPAMRADLAMLMTCFDQGIASHLSGLQSALHTRTGLDPDVIDDMMTAVAGWSGDDGPPLDV